MVAPPTLLPPSLDGWPVAVSHDLDAVLPKCDVVYLLRMQRERMTEALIPSLREYTAGFGLTRRRVDLLDESTLVMHPGPMNRGVEIAAEVADLPTVRRRRPGAQRRRRPHGGSVPAPRQRSRPHMSERSERSELSELRPTERPPGSRAAMGRDRRERGRSPLVS